METNNSNNVTTNIFYDLGKMLSMNFLIMFIIGIRGGGKTYGAKIWCVNDYIKRGNMFVWSRRTGVELDEQYTDWWTQISHKYPGYSMEVNEKKGRIYIYKTKMRDSKGFNIENHVAGYFIAISQTQHKKSNPYGKVNKWVYDEFIPEPGKNYLKHEDRKFWSLYETMNRLRIEESAGQMLQEIRVLFIGNAVSMVNPYFLKWNIRPIIGREYSKYGNIVIHWYKSTAFLQKKLETRSGQTMAKHDKEYFDYMYSNNALMDNNNFIEERPASAFFLFSITYQGNTYGIWTDYNKGKMYMSTAYDPDTYKNYALSLEDHTPNTMLVKSARKTYYLKNMIDAYSSGYMYFDNQTVKQVGLEILELLR